MSKLCNLFILLQVISHQLVDPSVELLALLLKVFELFVEGCITRRFNLVQSLFVIAVLPFKAIDLHLLEADFMFRLCAIALLVLLKLGELLL